MLENQHKAPITKAVAITGLGGVGKTQLAIEYAWQAIADGIYHTVLWIRGMSGESIEGDLATFAVTLGLPEADANEDTVRRSAVLQWLRETSEPWLIIADNVDDENVSQKLRAILPVSSIGHVIVTSRLEAWPSFGRVILDVLTPSDAGTVLQSAIKEDAPNHDAGGHEGARLLAVELGCLPIALRQAAAYIAEARWTFDKYRHEFLSQRTELLNSNKLDTSRYPEPVATTWTISLARLRAPSRRILQLCSFLAPDEIPRTLFGGETSAIAAAVGLAPEATSVQVDQHLAELARFSLIKLTKDTITVHRLLQAVEQDELRREHTGTSAFQAALFLVNMSYDVHDLEHRRHLRPHAEALLVTARRLEVSDVQTVLLESALTAYLVDIAEYKTAEMHARATLSAAESLIPVSPPLIRGAQNNLGIVLLAQNRLTEASSLLGGALASLRALDEPPSFQLASLVNNLAGLKEDLGQLDEAAQLYSEAVAVIRQLPASVQRGELSKVIGNYGTALKGLGRVGEAEVALREALSLSDPNGTGRTFTVARALNDLGFLLRDLERYDEAEPLLRRALEIAELNFGSSHPQVAAPLDNLGSLLRLSGRAYEAEPLLRRALIIQEEHLGADHPKVAVVLVNLALLLAETERPGEAERLFRRALRIDEQNLGPEHREVAHDLDRLGNFLASIGRFDEAELLTKKALAIADKLESPDSKLHTQLHNRLKALRKRRKGRRRFRY